MTKKLYYEDAYKREFTAEIQEVKEDKGGFLIRLDQTAFYPEGGGQPADTGTLTLADGSVLRVTDVQEEAEKIWHMAGGDVGANGVTAAKLLVNGAQVRGEINWKRRFDHMQQHSGEHIVSGMICEMFQCHNTGFHLGKEEVVIDYDAPIRFEEVLEIEKKANQYIWEDHPLLVLWPDEEELLTLPYRSKKALSGNVRITAFPGADMCACCGTHVSGSAQVGLVKFLSAEKIREGTRLTLLCGNRAMDFLSMNYQVNKQTAVLMSTSEENTADRVQKLLSENAKLKETAHGLEEQLLKLLSEQYAGKDSPLVIEKGLTAVQGRKLADLLADLCKGTVAVFSGNGNGYAYALINRGNDLSGFVKEMNVRLEGRGGGRNGFAQGSVQADTGRIRAFFEEKEAEN